MGLAGECGRRQAMAAVYQHAMDTTLRNSPASIYVESIVWPGGALWLLDSTVLSPVRVPLTKCGRGRPIGDSYALHTSCHSFRRPVAHSLHLRHEWLQQGFWLGRQCAVPDAP